MMRSMTLAYSEMKRIRRSGKAITAVLAVPVLAAAACVFTQGFMLRNFFPVLAAFSTWILLYVRYSSDMASGFASGIDSTPARGVVVFVSRFLTWLLIAIIQMLIFFAVIRLAA